MLLIASILAVSTGYYLWTSYWSSSLQPARGLQMASLAVKGDAPRSSIGQQDLSRTAAEDGDRAISVQREISSQRPEILQLPSASEGEPVAMLQPSATREQATPSSKTGRVLDPEGIKLLMKQGEQLIAAGDVATARTVLRRAADAGDANAAMALGATYDPNVLARLGVVGVSAEVEKVRSWYQKAETLGSPDARRRLDLLANR
jgi:TPR repeat protein